MSAAAASESLVIRPAEPHEAPLVLSFVRELAEYERLSHEVVATEEGMRQALFGPRPYAEVIFACLNGEPVGFALFCYNFSTFLARPGIHLEDLFVRPKCRGRGIGQKLLSWLAREALARGCGRLEWAVLDWNEPSIKFYDSLGARALKEWFTYRLSGESLEKVASRP
jgi:GNAT superfamily N-acetyltransferase